MLPSDSVGCTFVNTVVGRGVLNGVVNISFGTFNFTPTDDGQVNVDPTVSCRLRMDKVCATQLRDVMNELLAAIEKAEQDAAMGIHEKPQSDGPVPVKKREQL